MVKELIIKLIDENTDIGLTINEIKKKLASYHFSVEEIMEEINALRNDGIIFLNKDNKYINFPPEYNIGTIEKTKKGAYSININNQCFSINKELLNSALINDIVIVEKMSNGKYQVIDILKRITKKIVCEVKYNELHQKVLIPLYINQEFKIDIGSKDMAKLIEGEIVSVELTEEKYNDACVGKLLSIVGHKNDPDINLKTIALANEFNPEFNQESLIQADSIPLQVTPKDLTGRLDLRNENIFTIDGDHTKDIDDAVSIKKLENGNYKLSVHIAHVSNYVKPDTAIFNEAEERGNSLYMLDTVIPMLPRRLSNGICSLNPHEDRLTRSVIMTINPEGEVIDYNIVKSVINSKKQMTYDNVNLILENNQIPEGYEPFVIDLQIMQELSQILTEKHNKNGYLDFSSNETEFVFDENNNPISVHERTQKSAEKLIENFMIEANCVIARHAYYQELPFIYRNHGIPDNTRISETFNLLKVLGYRLNKLSNIEDPATIQTLLENYSNKEEYPILSSLILRAMQRAYYNMNNIGHYGLSADCYTHYTSPIRRLSDLLVHTLLDTYEETYEIPDNIIKRIERDCETASRQEKNADIAEYQAYKLASIQLMNDYIGQTFEGYILDINNQRLKIKLNNGIEGIIDLVKLNIPYKYLEKSKTIILTETNEKLLIGQKIPIVLEDTSLENLELYFSYYSSILDNNRLKKIRRI